MKNNIIIALLGLILSHSALAYQNQLTITGHKTQQGSNYLIVNCPDQSFEYKNKNFELGYNLFHTGTISTPLSLMIHISLAERIIRNQTVIGAIDQVIKHINIKSQLTSPADIDLENQKLNHSVRRLQKVLAIQSIDAPPLDEAYVKNLNSIRLEREKFIERTRLWQKPFKATAVVGAVLAIEGVYFSFFDENPNPAIELKLGSEEIDLNALECLRSALEQL